MAFSNSRMATNLFCSTPNDRQNQKRARVGSNTCPKCESTLKDTSEYQTCSVCELDFCIKCTGISTALMSALQEDTTNNFMWTYNCCKQNFPSMTSMKTQKYKGRQLQYSDQKKKDTHCYTKHYTENFLLSQSGFFTGNKNQIFYFWTSKNQ